MSVKFQVTLPETLAADLKRTAKRLKIPRAQFIREAIERRLRELKNTKFNDPFASITGIADTEETDLSGRVDEIVYGGGPHGLEDLWKNLPSR